MGIVETISERKKLIPNRSTNLTEDTSAGKFQDQSPKPTASRHGCSSLPICALQTHWRRRLHRGTLFNLYTRSSGNLATCNYERLDHLKADFSGRYLATCFSMIDGWTANRQEGKENLPRSAKDISTEYLTAAQHMWSPRTRGEQQEMGDFVPMPRAWAQRKMRRTRGEQQEMGDFVPMPRAWAQRKMRTPCWGSREGSRSCFGFCAFKDTQSVKPSD
jgi:hypothetical protein